MYTASYNFLSHPSISRGRRARLRAGGAMLVALGAGHSLLLLRADHEVPRGWIQNGLVDTVQIGVWDAEPVPRSVLRERVHYWAGIGSFAVPSMLLGLLVIEAANDDRSLPGWLGPALAAWSGLAGVIMSKAPWPLAVASGALIASAAAPSTPRG